LMVILAREVGAYQPAFGSAVSGRNPVGKGLDG